MLQNTKSPPRLMFASLSSGSGKTVITLGVTSLLKQKGYSPCVFKCGPDFLDGALHRQITKHTGNLDLFFCKKSTLLSVFFFDSKDCNIIIQEACMGLFDGLNWTKQASSYSVAQATKTPILLIIDARGAAYSITANILGAIKLQTTKLIKGVILNQCSKTAFDMLSPVIQKVCKIKPLGYIPKSKDFLLKSQQLGLCVPDFCSLQEQKDFKTKIKNITKTLQQTLDINAIIKIAKKTRPLKKPKVCVFDVAPLQNKEKPVIAVAKDSAFFFYYTENLNLLAKYGAKIVYFSPLQDKALPENTKGIYIGGGYPENYKSRLLKNKDLILQIKQCYKNNIPIFAECGGFLYLQYISLIKGQPKDTGGLVRFGYCKLKAKKTSLIAQKGQAIKAHEFHHLDTNCNGNAFIASKLSGLLWQTGYATSTLYAGFPHLFFPSCPDVAKRFVEAASKVHN